MRTLYTHLHGMPANLQLLPFVCRRMCPAGVKVWSFNPPGGMVTANLARALQGTVTSVAVGKDVISRTGTVTFERLLDQVGGAVGCRGTLYCARKCFST